MFPKKAVYDPHPLEFSCLFINFSDDFTRLRRKKNDFIFRELASFFRGSSVFDINSQEHIEVNFFGVCAGQA